MPRSAWAPALCLAACLAVLPATAADLDETLPNGLRVRLRGNPDLQLAHVGMFFAAGRATDPDTLAGLAHLAEHLLTESSPAWPDGGLMRQATLWSTYRNAATSGSFMHFETRCLPEFLPRILEVEAERLRGSGLDEAAFAREKSVVLQELAYRARRGAWSAELEQLCQAAYAGHPLGEDVGGSPETLQRVTLADFEAFRARHVVPRRAVLVVSGPIDPDSTLALVRGVFREGAPAVSEPLELPPLPERRPVHVVTDSRDFDGVNVTVGCRIPLPNARAAILASALTDLLSVEGVAMGTLPLPGETLVWLRASFAYDRPPDDPSRHYGYVYQPFDPDQDAQEALAYIWRQVNEAVDGLADEKAFTARRDALDDGRSHFATGAAWINGNAVPTATQVKVVLEGLTGEAFAAFVQEALAPGQATVVVAHGRDSEREQAVRLAGRAAPGAAMGDADALASLTAAEIAPVLAAYGRSGAVTVERRDLSNGVPFLYMGGAGGATVRLGGWRRLPPQKVQRPGDKPGIADLYNWLVEYDDRQKRDPRDSRYRPRRLDYDLNMHLYPGRLHFSAEAPAGEVRQAALALARRLDSREFNQERWYRLTRLGADWLAESAARADRRAAGWRLERVLGSEWRDLGWYRPDPEIVADVRYKDLSGLHRQVAGETGAMVLFGQGDAALDEVLPAVEMAFGGRGRYRRDPAPAVEPPALDGPSGRVFTDPGRGDVRLTVTFPAAPGPAPGALDEWLLRTALQQALQSRLREAEGLTYAVWVTSLPMAGATVWEVAVTCRPGQGPAVLQALRDEVRRIDGGGFTADELARARLAACGQLLDATDVPGIGLRLLDRLANLPPPPPDLLAGIMAVDDAALNAMAAAALDADAVTYTAVGPLLEEDLERYAAE
jgi:predicted Zn-dependent peptidase